MTIEVKKFDSAGRELTIRFGMGGIKAVGVSMVEHMIENREKNNGFQDIYDFASNAGSKAINKKALEALAKSGSFDSIHPSRKQIVESVEIICKYASAQEEERNSDQMNLFASSNIIEEKPALKKVNEWEKDQKLQEEFKAFGFFLNEHPIDNFLDGLRRRGVISSEDLEELIDNDIVKLAGVIAYSKHKSGPRGRYAYITLSDPFGIFETAVFDEELITLHRDKMTDGNSLVIECLARKDQGGLRLLVKTLHILEEFVESNPARKEPYKDIKQQKRRGKFDWKNKSSDSKPDQDRVAEEMQHHRRMQELSNKEIVPTAEIKISSREIVLRVKSLLSQRCAPAGFDKFTQVFFLIDSGNGQFTKIAVDGKYLIDEKDLEKIKSITQLP
ncbi:MAG: DNA polymerase III alpha subunit [Lentimonas sp.]|jgi:DNA polymerase III alpha subunit